MPSKELPPDTELRRAPLLEAQVEIEIAAGDIDRARSAADELELVAARFESKALVAGATLAQGRVRLAEGDTADAERLCSEAARLWSDVGAPYEAALARLGLADCPARRRQRSTRPRWSVKRPARCWTAIEAARTAEPEARPKATRSSTTGCREQSSVARATTGRWRSRGARCACATSRACGTSPGSSRDPGRELHVLDLVAAENGAEPVEREPRPACVLALGDAGEMLDARAKDAYRRRLAEIEEDIEEARASGDAERAAQADAERDFLVRELSRAVGLGGRERRAGSASERARAA